jgi:Secretion system C-terminal sorting domain/Leucine Rich repeats (2 copies)
MFKFTIIIQFLLILFINISYSSEIIYKISQHEADELSKLYNSAGGEDWSNNYNWSSNVSTTLTQISTPYNMVLYGVVFRKGEIISEDENAAIFYATAINITITEEGINGIIPNFNLPNLDQLNLSRNQLNGELPIFNLPNLEKMLLGENNLSGEIPNFNMPKLKILWLGENNLSGEIPDLKLPELERLWLDENQLNGELPKLNLPKLKELSIIYNQLNGKIPNFDLPELEYLALSFNKLSGEIPDFDLPKLERMYLNNNELSGNVPEFNNLVNLKVMRLDSNKFTFGALEVNLDKYDYYQYKDQDTILPIEQIGNKIKVTVDGSSNTYTWFLEEQEVSSGISKTYRPSETGTYHCEVTNSLLPDLTLSSGTINVLTVGIAVEDEDRYLYYLYNFPPYPQPASNEVKIPIYWRLGNPVSSDNIKIYNNMGVEIKQENKIKIEESTSINGEVIWDASGVDSGIYFLEIRHGTSTKYVKILLE